MTLRRKRVVAALFGLVFGFLAAEAALRAVGYGNAEFYSADVDRGYALTPGASGWYRKESRAFIQINSDGLRDIEHDRAKPDGTFRIAILGDSFAEALQIPIEQTFWMVMQNNLAACRQYGGKRIEVINFGVSGYGTAQELITLQKRVWRYSPDLVILAFTTNNDVTDNLRATKAVDAIPYFVLRDGGLERDDSYLNSNTLRLRSSSLYRLGSRIENSSRVIQAIRHASRAIRLAWEDWRTPKRKNESESAVDSQTGMSVRDGSEDHLYREPTDGNLAAAWKVTEALIREMNRETIAHGSEFLLVTLSNPIQVFPDRPSRERAVSRLGATDIFYPDNRIKALGEREGIRVICLAPELQRYADSHGTYLHGFAPQIGDGHWNELGHRVAGDHLSNLLCKDRAERKSIAQASR